MKLIDLLTPEFIKLPLKGRSKVDVIKELIDVIAEQGLVDDKEKALQAVLDREKIMTTGVGHGVAIPHCKYKCSRFAIALGIHPEGVDFESLDKQPAHIVFLLIGPEDDPGTHVRLLSRISRIIMKEDVRSRILQSHSPQEVYEILKAEESKYFELSA